MEAVSPRLQLDPRASGLCETRHDILGVLQLYQKRLLAGRVRMFSCRYCLITKLILFSFVPSLDDEIWQKEFTRLRLTLTASPDQLPQ